MKKLNSILLIEDDEIIHFLNQKILGQMGVADNIVWCRNGVEALSYIKGCLKYNRDWLPDLILLDTHMPIMDGYGFLEEFQAIKPKDQHIPVFMLTTLAYPDAIIKAHSYDIDGYLIKPLDKDIVEKVILKAFSNESTSKEGIDL